MDTFPWLETLLVITGVVLLLVAGYLYFQQWLHMNMRTRVYTYISEAERDKRSLKAGFATVIFTFGISFILSAFIKPVTLQSIAFILILGAFASPLLLLAATFRMRKDLEPYTKMKDDIVFLDEKQRSKH